MSHADTLRRVFALMDETNDRAIRELLAPEFSAVTGGDKLIEHRAEVDMAGLMQQLRAIPAPAAA